MSLLATTTSPEAPTAPPRPRWRRALPWVGIVLALLIAGVLTFRLETSLELPPPLDPDSNAPDGARAVATILTDQGVDVAAADRLDAALSRGDGHTIVVTDARILDGDALDDLAGAAAHLVLANADLAGADAFFPDIAHGGYGSGEVAPDCALPVAQRAGAVTAGRAYDAPGAQTACYPAGDGAALVQTTHGDATVTLIDGPAILANEHLAEAGNAALALGLLGAHERVVWYTPSAADAAPAAGPPTLHDIAPDWVTPVIVLGAIAAVAAGIWRGRRFGPLVAERLPVTVRASETLEGRARLYARSGDAAHAYEAISRGATRRIAVRLGLAPNATPQEVSLSAAAALGRPHDEILGILLARPQDDAELSDAGHRIRALERALDDTGPWEGHRS